MVAKKPAAKTPTKRKPAKKKPVDHAKIAIDQLQADFGKKPIVDSTTAIPWKTYAKNIAFGVAMLAFGAAGGIWSAGGIAITPTPRSDVLSQAYDADRQTQIAVLRELAAQPFDGATDDGRKAAGTFFNAQRFRNRATDFADFTDRVADSIAANSEADLAAELESK